MPPLQPIVFVHGVTLRASMFAPHRQYYMQRGFSSAELYATTYGDGGVQPLNIKKMECRDVKQVGNSGGGFLTLLCPFLANRLSTAQLAQRN